MRLKAGQMVYGICEKLTWYYDVIIYFALLIMGKKKENYNLQSQLTFVHVSIHVL